MACYKLADNRCLIHPVRVIRQYYIIVTMQVYYIYEVKNTFRSCDGPWYLEANEIRIIIRILVRSSFSESPNKYWLQM